MYYIHTDLFIVNIILFYFITLLILLIIALCHYCLVILNLSDATSSLSYLLQLLCFKSIKLKWPETPCRHSFFMFWFNQTQFCPEMITTCIYEVFFLIMRVSGSAYTEQVFSYFNRNTTPIVPHSSKPMRMRPPSGPLFCPLKLQMNNRLNVPWNELNINTRKEHFFSSCSSPPTQMESLGQ